MAEYLNSLTLTDGLHIKASKPVDDRMVRPSIESLYTINKPYEGMVVSVPHVGVYQLDDVTKYTTSEGWTKIGVSTGGTTKVPTKVSELANDAGYLTEHQSLENYALQAKVDESLINLSLALGDNLQKYQLKEEGKVLSSVDVTQEMIDSYATKEYVGDVLTTNQVNMSEMYEKKEEGKGLSSVDVTQEMVDRWDNNSTTHFAPVMPSIDSNEYATMEDLEGVRNTIYTTHNNMAWTSEYDETNGILIGHLDLGGAHKIAIYVPKFAMAPTPTTKYTSYFSSISLNDTKITIDNDSTTNFRRTILIDEVSRSEDLILKFSVVVYKETTSQDTTIKEPDTLEENISYQYVSNIDGNSDNQTTISYQVDIPKIKETTTDIDGIVRTQEISLTNNGGNKITLTLEYERNGYGLQWDTNSVGILDKNNTQKITYNWSAPTDTECVSIKRSYGKDTNIPLKLTSIWTYCQHSNDGTYFGETVGDGKYDSKTQTAINENEIPPMSCLLCKDKSQSYAVKVQDVTKVETYQYFFPIGITAYQNGTKLVLDYSFPMLSHFGGFAAKIEYFGVNYEMNGKDKYWGTQTVSSWDATKDNQVQIKLTEVKTNKTTTVTFTREGETWSEQERKQVVNGLSINFTLGLCFTTNNEASSFSFRDKTNFEKLFMNEYNIPVEYPKLENGKLINPYNSLLYSDCALSMERHVIIEQDASDSNLCMEYYTGKQFGYKYDDLRVVGCERISTSDVTDGFFTFESGELKGDVDGAMGLFIIQSNGKKQNCTKYANYYPVVFGVGLKTKYGSDTGAFLRTKVLYNEVIFTDNEGNEITTPPIWWKGAVEYTEFRTWSGIQVTPQGTLSTNTVFAEENFTKFPRSFRIYIAKDGIPLKGVKNDNGQWVRGMYITVTQNSIAEVEETEMDANNGDTQDANEKKDFS